MKKEEKKEEKQNSQRQIVQKLKAKAHTAMILKAFFIIGVLTEYLVLCIADKKKTF